MSTNTKRYGVVVFAVVAIVVAGYQLLGRGQGGEVVVNSDFYTADDGKTFFKDEVGKLVPFSSAAGQVVRAHIYTCDGGKTRFVGYLQRYSEATLKAIAAERTQTGNEVNPSLAPKLQAGVEIKLPGAKSWVPESDHEQVQRLVNVKCPDNQPGTPEPVLP